MPMPIKVRASFTQDANYVERLKQAIELDDDRDPAWKTRAIAACNDLTILLRQADIERMQKENGNQQRKRKAGK